MNGHYINGIVQYNHKLEHFRTLRMYGKSNTKVLDGKNEQYYNRIEDRYELIEDP